MRKSWRLVFGVFVADTRTSRQARPRVTHGFEARVVAICDPRWGNVSTALA